MRYWDHPLEYIRFDFKKPWNSPENLQVLKNVDSYHCPLDAGSENSTSYVAVLGLDEYLPDILIDGSPLRQAFVVIELANTNIPWSAPRDIRIEELLAQCDATYDRPADSAQHHLLVFMESNEADARSLRVLEKRIRLAELREFVETLRELGVSRHDVSTTKPQ